MPLDDAAALDDIIVELYAVAPGEFLAERTRRARDAEAGLAPLIAKIRKPVVSAWAVDLLAREGHLADALELGAALREAQEELDAAELSRLGRQRRQLVAALARTAADLASEAGVAVSAAAQTDIEATLNAALIDAAASAAVATARLAKPLEASGGVDLADAVSGSVPEGGSETSEARPDDELAERRARREAERAAREADRDVERTERDQARALEQRDRAQARLDRLRDRVDALRVDLERAERDAAEAEAELEPLVAAARTAVTEARGAARRAAAAHAALS